MPRRLIISIQAVLHSVLPEIYKQMHNAVLLSRTTMTPFGGMSPAAAACSGYGNSCGTEQFLVTTKNDTGESRLALDALTTSTTVKGTTTNHAAVCVQSEVLMVRKTSCYRSCCFHHDQYVLGCQGWTKHVLFPQSRPQLNQLE